MTELLPDFAIHAYAQGTDNEATLARMLLDAREELAFHQAIQCEMVDTLEWQFRKLKRLKRKLRRARAATPLLEQAGRGPAR